MLVKRTTTLETPAAVYGDKPSFNKTGFITKPPPIPNVPAKTPEIKVLGISLRNR